MSFFIHSLLFFTLLILYFANAEAEQNCSDKGSEKVKSSGTGTVLFNPTDVYKTCWSQDEIALLTARIYLEDVIPDARLISIQCNEEIDDIVEYFKAVIDSIRLNTKARQRHIMLLALTDLLGGFIHHALLPLAKKAYYSGAVDYTYMEKIIQLYQELKWFLRTNGQGWTKPMVITKEVNTPLIEIPPVLFTKENETCCHKVMFYEHEPLRAKRSVSTEKGVYFPLPFFDAKVRPTAIAVPLRRFAVRNIESKRAAYVIMKYFISAEQCLKEKKASTEMVQKFENNLYTWIEKDVLPKLKDDKFYAAFGGILRVHNTLKASGAKLGNKPCVPDEAEEDVGATPGAGCSSRRNKLLLIAMLVVIVAWFLIGTCFICYRMRHNKSSHKPDLDDSKSSKGSASTASFSSSKWSSFLSRSSSKTESNLCKCCESTISEKSTANYSSTSEYDSEKSKRKERRNAKFSSRKSSRSSPCMCPLTDGPAVIEAKHEMKKLPSIAEMSEQSIPMEKSPSYRKITFADDSGMSSSDGGAKVCIPPWAKAVPCPALTDKGANYSTSKSYTTNTHTVPDASVSHPVASSTRTHDLSSNQKSKHFDSSDITHSKNEMMTSRPSQKSKHFDSSDVPHSKNEMMTSRPSHTTREVEESFSKDEPLANSTIRIEDLKSHDTSNSAMDSSDKIRIEDLKSHDTSNSAMGSSDKSVEKHGYIVSGELSDEEEEPTIVPKKEGKDLYDYHMDACHSTMSGNYDLFHRTDPSKPYIFGYDFQTTTSSELSDDE